MPRFENYRIFEAVCRTGSFTRAADFLGTGQPAVSRSIAVLEQELGCQLFLRQKQGVTLTPNGERLYTHVKAACEEIRQAEEELQEQPISGSVRIGASETALHSFLFPRLHRFQTLYPGVRLLLHNVTTPKAEKELQSGEIDFGVVSSPVRTSSSIAVQILAPYREILIAGEKYRKRPDRMWSLRELTGVPGGGIPWIGMEQGSMTDLFYREWFSKNHFVYRSEIEVATVDMILSMVQQGFGIGFVPLSLAQAALQAERVWEIPLCEKVPPRQICLLQKKGMPLSGPARQLYRLILEKQEE